MPSNTVAGGFCAGNEFVMTRSSQSKNPFQRNSYRYWFGAETLLAVSESATLAVTLLLIDITGSVGAAGRIASFLAIIELIATLVGGALGDLISRRTLITTTVRVGVVTNVSLCALAFFSSQLEKNQLAIYATVFFLTVSSVCIAMTGPALDGSLKELITAAEFPRAMSAAQARSSSISIASAPTTGLIYGINHSIPFALRAVCEALFLPLLRRIPDGLGPNSRPPRLKVRSVCMKLFTSYHAGLAYLLRDRLLRVIVLCTPLVNVMVFTGTAWATYYLRAEGHSPFHIGLVSASFAFGLVAGSALAPYLTDHVPSGWLAIGGLTWLACWFAALFTAHGNLLLMSVFAAVAMLFSPALNGALFGHVFSRTESGFQGRIFAIFSLASGLAAVVAPLLAAFAVERAIIGPLVAIVCALSATGILLLLATPEVRRLPTL